MSEGQGFQFTMGGMQPLVAGEKGTVPAGPVVPHVLPEERTQDETAPYFAAPANPQPPQPKAQRPIAGPGAVVREAKRRIREIKAELKDHAKLKKELAELERLVKAAKEKPSNLRSIKRAG